MKEKKLPAAWQPPKWKKLKKLVDLVAAGIEMRDERKALEARAEMIQKEEEALKAHVVASFEASELTEVKTRAGTARLVTRVLPQADTKNDPEAWAKIYEYMKSHDAFDLLQKRLHEAACKERWENKINIPGVVKFTKKDLKLGDAE